MTFEQPDIPGEMGLFAFTPEGFCFATTTRARHLSLGTWRPTRGGFEYTFRHFTYADDDGEWLGEVRVRQVGTLSSANSWTASGTGTAVDTNGNVIRVVDSATVGERY